MGSLEESAGLARMAFRQTPREEELNPILPTMPAYTVLLHQSQHPKSRNPNSGFKIQDHVNRKMG
jgi:hypothetical protein